MIPSHHPMRQAFYVFAASLFALGILIHAVAPAPVAPETEPEPETGEEPEPETPLVTFPFEPAGTLVQGSGTGIADETLWAPDIRFPTETAEAYANSQVYGAGGMYGPAGGQCAASNYRYPWHDNFCETRDRTNIFCPAGKGHQGQDIRPATCEKSKYWAVAVESGQITAIGSYSITLTADSGLLYRYLHLDMARLAVKQGDTVTKGQRIGYVSNDFGGTATTIHLHFEIKANVLGADGQPTITFVSPYMSLVRAYERLLTEEAKTPVN